DDGGGDVWCLCLSFLVGLARDSIETRDRQGSLETDFVLAPSGLSLVRLLSAHDLHGSSRVITRPASRVRRPSKSHGSGRIGSGGLRNLSGRVGSGRVGVGRFLKSVGSSRVTLTRPDP
ncbi:unnamed protein product, partial [Laminaria digitata]